MPNHLNFWKNHLVRRWHIYVLGFLMVALCNVMQVVSARTIGYIIDFFNNKSLPDYFPQYSKEETFYLLFFIMVVARIFLTIGRFGWRRTLGRETHLISGTLKTKIWDNVRFMSMDLLNRKFTKGELMNATTSDVGSARFIFGWTLVATADVLFLTTFTVISMLFINIPLTIYSLGVLVFIPFFVQKISHLEIERYRGAQEYLSQFNDLSSQAVASIRLQRVTQTGLFWSQKLYKSAEQYRQKRIKAVNTSLLYMPCLGLETLLAYGVIFFVGLEFVLSGKITAGDFVAMQGLILLIEDPLFELGYIISDFRKASVSMKRLDDIYQAPRLEHISEEGENVVFKDLPVLQLKNISFRYPESDKDIITDFSVDIYRGSRLGIIGPIGSGKSSLIQILAGLERRVKGEILFKGRPFDDYKHQSLRDYISIVPQKPFLFADTVRNNVSMGEKLNDDEVWYYLKLAGLEKDVKAFEHQLDTQLGEWGINLSGGQKQRLTLARALASKPKMLLLDDCLSAVDTVTEQLILDNLNEYLSETTLVWVAHRQSTLKYCDNIIEMEV